MAVQQPRSPIADIIQRQQQAQRFGANPLANPTVAAPHPTSLPITQAVPAVAAPQPQALQPYASIQNQPAFSAFDPNSIGRSGTYGESVAVHATDYLKKLRAALDAGQISVADFLKFGQPAAQTALKEATTVGGQGSKAANIANPLVSQIGQFGFSLAPDGTVKTSLPQQYQQDAIKQLLPSNISPEDQQKYISQLPPGLDPFSDKGQIELENIRQRAQAADAQKQQQALRDKAITGTGGLQDILGQQAAIRNQGISSLGQSLDQEANRQFSLDQPGVYENLNARGLLHSSALGEALARQKSVYAGDIANRLGQAQLANTQQGAVDLSQLSAARMASTDADVQAIQQNLLNSNQLQQSGLSRQFGTQDFATQANLARQIAASQQPQSTGGGGIGGAFTGALGGAGIGAQVGGGPGALVGGVLGATGGYASGRSSGGSTFLCTELFHQGLITRSEIDQVHDKVFGKFFKHPIWLFLYWLIAPVFIRKAPSSFDWRALKVRLVNEIIATENQEEAFKKYRDVCVEIFADLMPRLKPVFKVMTFVGA